MSNKETIIKYLNSEINWDFCDDCLSDQLLIKPRQQVNQICRANGKLINRVDGACDICKKDKIVNSKLTAARKITNRIIARFL